MVDLLKGIIPSHIQVTIIADGEFCSPAFLKYIHRNGYHYNVRMKKNILFNGKKIGSYSIRTDASGLYDFGLGKYSNGMNEKRLLALLSIYTLSYMSMYEMTKGIIVKDGRYSFYTRFRNKMIYTMGKDIFLENLNNLRVSHGAFK